ncbi:photosystem I reaction center protein subunit XI [Aphanothece sacrum]|uniref:Photosystem I reaction center subunit XI n=1 Tax=Aphanothece sacrum FPU1 TaxID=1920663 RepID=A0A401IE01_APHSA|nr:photosystem I reaction center protein subunit XI [Aphanothece sacrum]GBF79449.1 photosystem I reaction center protein subunit XI [Aphanothece sacrum FPU1]GBF86001.1 photosystem I reaction center protein PsaL2 [Aphanothece sacrum FPU3]
MAETGYTQMVKAYNDDPFTGHLSTPISDSGFTRALINNLPIYRKGLSPLARGLEVGLAHGYFLIGPEVVLGPGRDFSADPYLSALLTAVVIVVIGTIGLNAHGLVSLKSATECEPGTDAMQTSEGWSLFASGFFLGGAGSAFMAYFLLEKFSTIDAIFRGFVN